MSTVTSSSSVSPIARPSLRIFSANPPGSSRLNRSPCSSRSTIAVCSIRRRLSAPAVPVLAPADSLRNSSSTESAIAAAVVPRDAGDRLDRPALGDLVQQVLVGRGEAGVVGDRLHQRLDDLRVEHRAAGRHLAHCPGELVALADPVLEEVGVAGGAVAEQGDGVVGVVVLRQHDHAGAGVALAELLGRVDALPLEARRHADVGDEHLGRRRLGPGEEAVVVVGRPDHIEVGFQREQRTHPLADDHVVVGEEHGDASVPHGSPFKRSTS